MQGHRELCGLLSAPAKGGDGGRRESKSEDAALVCYRDSGKTPTGLFYRVLFVNNASLLIHKMDELELLIKGNRHVRDCCVSIIIETWLHPLIPDAAIQLAACTAHRWDCNKDSSKSRGVGLLVCAFIYIITSATTTLLVVEEGALLICPGLQTPRLLSRRLNSVCSS